LKKKQQQEEGQGKVKKAKAAHGKETKVTREEKKKLVEKEGDEEQEEQRKEQGGGGGGKGVEESSSTILPSLMSVATSLPSAISSSSSSSSSPYVPAKHDRFCPPTTHKLYLNGALLEFGTWLGDMGRAHCGYVLQYDDACCLALDSFGRLPISTRLESPCPLYDQYSSDDADGICVFVVAALYIYIYGKR
jgi:hypothetical protein